MQDSSSDEQNINIFNYNFNQGDSVNDTAASFLENNNGFQVDDDDYFAQDCLKQFYQRQLKIEIDFRFEQLEKDVDIFPNGVVGAYPPEPLVYFLPYTILLPSSTNLNEIRSKIGQKYRKKVERKEVQINILFKDDKKRDQLFITIRTNLQLVYYKIKKVSINTQFHKYKDCLDKDLLVDRLFNFYKNTYEKFNFQEISVFFMYWAYTKNFLNQEYLSPSAIKVLIICLFINLGFGIKRILTSFQQKFWQRESNCLQMSKSNRKGECVIDRLILNYQNYSIEQKKGLYILSTKKYQIIRDVKPILFPIGERNSKKPHVFEYRSDEEKYFKQQAEKTFKKIKIDKKIKLSRYHWLFLLFKNMNDYFQFSNKIILDLKRSKIVFEENSDEFLLQIHHPVFDQVISKALVQNGSAARRIKLQLNQLMRKIKDNEEAIQNVFYIFSRK